MIPVVRSSGKMYTTARSGLFSHLVGNGQQRWRLFARGHDHVHAPTNQIVCQSW